MRALRVLLEMRPALDGHSGIPQETRLLFRGLASLEGIDVVGLIQSGNLVIDAGLPARGSRVLSGTSREKSIDVLSKVVVSLQQGAASHRVEHIRKRLLKVLGPGSAALGAAVGHQVKLGGFESQHFKDFLWRAMFAKSLPESDFETVTSQDYLVMRWPWSMMHAAGVVTAQLGHALYPRLDTSGVDVMLVETPYPGRPAPGTHLVVRYHDAIPLLMPHTIKDRSYHRAAHFHALQRNARDGAWFACVSDATRQDLLSVMPQLESRAVTIPNMVSHHFHALPAPAERMPDVIWSRKNRQAPHGGGASVQAMDLVDGKLDYLLMVSTIEPRKNHLALVDAWETLRTGNHPRLNLVIVGSLGWDHEAIMRRFSPWLERGGLHLLSDVPATDLRQLYQHARVTVCPSFGEGFDFPGVESMRSGGVVAASDISVHRDVFGDACEYFSPYSTPDLVAALERLLGKDADERRLELVQSGALVSARYLPNEVLPLWHEFLGRVAGDSSRRSGALT